MSSSKELFQNFSDFRGLDVRSSDLSRPLNFAKEVKNFIIEQNFSLGGEKGLHLFANSQNSIIQTFFIGTHNYIYKDIDTGREVEELIAIGPKGATDGSGLYRLREGSLNITYSGSDTFGYEFLYNSSTGKLKLALIEDGSEVSAYTSVSGLEDDSTGPLSLSTVASAFSFISNFTVTVTGSGNAYAGALPLVSQTGIAPGTATIPFFYWEEVSQSIPYSSGSSPFEAAVFNHDQIESRPPTFINKNNCCYMVCDGYSPLMKYDGVSLKQAGLFPISEDDITVAAGSNTPALVGDFKYYIRYVTRDAKGNFIYGPGAFSEVVTSASGEAPNIKVFDQFIGWEEPGFLISIGADVSTSSASNTATLNAIGNEDLLRARGFGELKAGDIILLLSGSGGIGLKKVISVDRENLQITFDGDPFSFSPSTSCYWANGAFMTEANVTTNSAQSNVSTITTIGQSGVEVGTWLFFPDEGEWYEVTDVDTNEITINGIVSIPSGTYRPSSIAMQVYRTEDGGLEKFYLSQELSSRSTFGFTFVDTTADADLGEELIIPDREPDPVFGCPGTLVQHQGIMIVAGGTVRSGRLRFEDFQYLEGFPLATNFYDVPSQDAGIITALWSDTYDQLAVFKDTAYYSVIGSFRDEIPIFNTIANTEQDLGIASQASLIKIRGLNIGIGKLGFVAFQGGQVDYEFTKQLNSEFLSDAFGEVFTESEKIRVNRAMAVNDRFKQQAYFLVPVFNVSDGTHTGANGESRLYVLDYSERTWTRRTFPSDLSAESSGLVAFPFIPTAGMVVYNDSLLLHSCLYDSTIGNGDYTDFASLLFKRKERQVLPSGIADYRHDYYDQHEAIGYEYKTGWFFSDTPIVDRLYHWLKVYAFNTADFVPFDLRIRTYIDWDESTAIDDVTLSFTSSTPFQMMKLKANRAQALQIRFTTEAVLQKPTLTGFELLTGEVDENIEAVR